MFKRICRKFSEKKPKKGVDIIREELKSNPEFDRAFPQLLKYKGPSHIPLEKKELDFIRSLL